MKCCICKKEIKGEAIKPLVLFGGKCCKSCDDNITKALDVFISTYEDCENAVLMTNDKVELIKPKGKYFTLKELQSAVGGYITICRTKFSDYYYVVDEEAKLKNAPVNKTCFNFFDEMFYGVVLLAPIKFIK